MRESDEEREIDLGTFVDEEDGDMKVMWNWI